MASPLTHTSPPPPSTLAITLNPRPKQSTRLLLEKFHRASAAADAGDADETDEQRQQREAATAEEKRQILLELTGIVGRENLLLILAAAQEHNEAGGGGEGAE